MGCCMNWIELEKEIIEFARSGVKTDVLRDRLETRYNWNSSQSYWAVMPMYEKFFPHLVVFQKEKKEKKIVKKRK